MRGLAKLAFWLTLGALILCTSAPLSPQARFGLRDLSALVSEPGQQHGKAQHSSSALRYLAPGSNCDNWNNIVAWHGTVEMSGSVDLPDPKGVSSESDQASLKALLLLTESNSCAWASAKNTVNGTGHYKFRTVTPGCPPQTIDATTFNYGQLELTIDGRSGTYSLLPLATFTGTLTFADCQGGRAVSGRAGGIIVPRTPGRPCGKIGPDLFQVIKANVPSSVGPLDSSVTASNCTFDSPNKYWPLEIKVNLTPISVVLGRKRRSIT